MSIIFVHGVNTRETEMPESLTAMLRHHVAPVISGKPEEVPIEYAYWGDVAAQFAWDGASRPRTPIIGMGANGSTSEGLLMLAASEPDVFEGMPASSAGGAQEGGLAAAGPGGAAPLNASVRLKSLSSDDLADLLAAVFTAEIPPGADNLFLLVLDEVVHDPALQAQLGNAADFDEEWDLIAAATRTRLAEQTAIAGMGFDWLDGIGSRVKEALSRGVSAPGYVLGRAVAEFRKPMNNFISVFLGDVFEYLKERGTSDSPGPIQKRFLDPLSRADKRKRDTGEPIVVLSHSMGGQVVYDAVTYFLPDNEQRRSIKIDFWCATASQVALFEELKLFKNDSDEIREPNKVAFPAANLGHWWNVWDHNDFISFTGSEIFEGIVDESYDSGMGLVDSHGGYLERPSFFRKFANQLEISIGGN